VESILNFPTYHVLEVRITFLFVFLNLALSLLSKVFSIATVARNRTYLSSLRIIQGNMIRVSVLIGLFYIFEPRIYFIAATTIIVTIFKAITNIAYTKRLLPQVMLKISEFRYSLVKELMSSGIWNSISQLSSVLLNNLDLLITNIFIGVYASGQFALAQTIPLFIQTFSGMLQSAFLPHFLVLFSKEDKSRFLESIVNSTKFMGLATSIPIGFLIVFGDIFFSLWIPTQNSSELHLLTILILVPLVLSGSVGILYNVFTVTNKLKIPSVSVFCFGFVKVLIILLLLRFTNLGILAVPITGGGLRLIRNLIFTPLYASYCLGFEWNVFYKSIFLGIASTMIMVVISLLLRRNFQISSWMELFLFAFISGMVTLIVTLCIFFDRHLIKAFLNK